MLQIVSGVVLLHLAEAVHHLPTCQNSLHTKDTAMEVPITDQAQASSIGRDVATNVAAALGTKVQWNHKALFC